VAVSSQQPPAYSTQSIAGVLQPGDGGPAIRSFIQLPAALAVDPSGAVYIGQTFGAIRRVAPDGTITTIAGVPNLVLIGAGAPASTGDGGPAISAGIKEILGLALDGANNLYVSDVLGCRIRRINLQTGTIDNYAGQNGVCTTGADGPVAATSFNVPRSLLMDSQGRLLVVDANRLRRIDLTAGTVTTIAGNGTAGLTGNGGPAAQALIATPGGLAQDSSGNLYLSDPANCLVREIVAATGNLQTIAGATCGYSGDNGQASTAQLDAPGALLMDAGHNRLYVAESGTGSRIRAIDLTSKVITTYAGVGPAGLAGDGGQATAAQLAQPAGLAFDKNGALLVSESSNRVRRIDPFGAVTTFAGGATFGGDGGQASAALLYPSGGRIASDHKGGYVVWDQGNGRIRTVAANGVILTVAGIDQFAASSGDGGPALNAGVANVRGVAVDAAGNIYFVQGALAANPLGELRRITPNGTIGKFGSATYNGGACLGVDLARNLLYVCEAIGNRLDRVDLATGNVTVFAGSGSPGGAPGNSAFAGDNGPANQAQLSDPLAVSVDSQGNVFVFDQGHARIRKITPNGSNIQTIAGNGATIPGSGGLTYSSGDGGPATSASIYTYAGLAADAAGNVFIGEGNRIRRVEASSGIINTIAGDGTFGLGADGAGPALSAPTAVLAFDIDANGNLLTVDSTRLRLIANPSAPAIITVDMLGGFTELAQNAWIVIKGVNLAPTNLGASGLTWSSAPDFASGRMPTQLANVSVTVNGKPAFIYYVSPTQINALTPLDDSLGPVQVVVTNGAVSSAPATMNQRVAAPSLFLVGATNYVLATHVDYSLVGPQAISAPGYPFTPAKVGETIVLYITGLGLPSAPLVNGSATQYGAMPALPVVQFGTAQATVSYAYVVGPGTYQVGVVVPAGAANGDNPLSVSYGGATTPLGALINAQP
jgi:uncharacterized protein (TIGR03437 family)